MVAEQMSTSFGRAAAFYERGRPEYPREAVEWLLAPVRKKDAAPRVVDVGAGTGKLTRALAGAGAEVVAIDPDPDMLSALRAAVPGIPTRVGAAEHLPLPDASVDAVLLGQAWHWVEPIAASAEVARVLRLGGVLGLIWNIRDDTVPWVARLGEIMRGSHAELLLAQGDPPVAAPFGNLDVATWHWSRPMTRAALTAMVFSRSYVITAPEEERARVGRESAVLFDEIGAVGEATVVLPYVTHAYRALRP